MNEALENVKRSDAALRQAFLDAGGKIGDGHNHNKCPFCQDESGFMLGSGQNGFASWACYAGKSDKCAIPPGKKTCGTIVDLLMRAHGIDSQAACKMAVERYGQAAGRVSNSPGGNGDLKNRPTKKGKLHLTVDAAIAAARFGISQRGNVKEVSLREFAPGEIAATHPGCGYFKYTDEKGAPVLSVARFDVVSKAIDPETKQHKRSKEFAPVHYDNGWRVGLGPWGKQKPLPLYNLAALTKALKEAGK